MSQNQILVGLVVVLALLLCCLVAICGTMGLVYLDRAPEQPGNGSPSTQQQPVHPIKVDPIEPGASEKETLRLLRQTSLPSRDLFDLAHRLQGQSLPASPAVQAAPPRHSMGDSETFWVHDVETEQHLFVTATLEYATPHAFWWVEEGYQLPTRDLKQSAERFETVTYPTTRRFFGSEWNPGVDGDPHVYILLANVPGVAGYFSGPDEYTTEIRPRSNEHEMFYINLENAHPGSAYFDGILAHEFQHMIHWAVDRDEPTWVNEGLSELASRLSGFDVGGSDYAFSLEPDTQLTAWAELDESAPHYGASYLFMSYFMERFGGEAITKLVAEQENGIAGFEAVMREVDPTQPNFDALFADWVVANYLDDASFRNGRFGYADIGIEPPELAAHYEDYPVREQATVHQYAADYIALDGAGDVTLEFTGSLRVPLLGNVAHSGEFQWWSNRGDEADSTLTHAFDLTGLSEATLQAWMWYDLEEDYDYAYVEVSADDGSSWTILANENTTDTDPNGNSYGPAFTGCSGSCDQPSWVLQAFDLTPYAGEPVLVRFEVIADEAVNHPGLSVDDITIPELGYHDDAEKDDGGWHADGWLRVTDHIPQKFQVQLITIGRENQLQPVALDSAMQGRVTIENLGSEIDRAVVVISALAPATTEAASYSYRITGD